MATTPLRSGFDMRRIRDDLLQTQTYSARGAYFFGTAQTSARAVACSPMALPARRPPRTAPPHGPTTWRVSCWTAPRRPAPAATSAARSRLTGPWYFFPYAADRWQVNKKLTVVLRAALGNLSARPAGVPRPVFQLHSVEQHAGGRRCGRQPEQWRVGQTT